MSTPVPAAAEPSAAESKLLEAWYVACFSSELRSKPLACEVLGVPLVLFRSAGEAVAVLDRCPHRNVPLSLGRVTQSGRLECAYHGWQFDRTGTCQLIPGLVETKQVTRSVATFAVREQHGLVWVCPKAGTLPDSEPFVSGMEGRSGYVRVLRKVVSPAGLQATVENALDVPHTAFVHRGLFRSGKQNPIQVLIRRYARHVEAEYRGEPRPSGAVGWLLAPGGGTVEHWDRFFLPAVAQVEYRLEQNHFMVTALCTPVSDSVTHIFAVVDYHTRFLSRAIKPLLEPLALWIFNQDARILERQTRNQRRFGGEQHMSTELDLLAPHVRRLLKSAERGTLPADGEPSVFEVSFRA